MQKLSNREKMRPWMGVVLQAVVVLTLLFIGSAMQRAWGLLGLVATEVLFLLMAIGYCLLRGVNPKEVFPVRKITIKDFFGTLLFTVGGLSASMIAVGLSMVLLPSQLGELTHLTDFLYGEASLPALLVVAAILPAVCEEAIQRGAVLSNFRNLKRDWVIVLIMGVFFGLFHLSPLRFLSTTILGMLLSYLMVKRNNILLPMLMHFLNNLVAVVSGSVSSGVDVGAAASLEVMQMLGVYLMLGFACPILLTLGAMLISPETHKKKRFLYAGLLSGVLLTLGIVLTAAAMGQAKPICDNQFNYEVTQDGENAYCTFDVLEAKTYTVSVVIEADGGTYTVELTDPDGNTILAETAGPPFSVTRQIEMKTGNYTARIIDGEDAVGQTPSIRITVR